MSDEIKPVKKPRKPSKKSKPVAKSWDYADVWQPLGGNYSGLSNTYDSFGEQRQPSPAEMIGAFSDTVFSAATMIAESLSEIDIQLVAETRAGQQAPANAPKTFRRPKHRSKGVELHELHDHPALDLLYRPNPALTYSDLIIATSLYMDIIGRAFWLLTPDNFGRPARIDVLPAQLIMTERDDNGAVVGYQIGAKQHKDDAPTYRPDQVLAFRRYEYFDPTGEGISPVRAVWLQLQLSHKELSSWESIVGQMAHPSVLLTPKDANVPMSEEAAERFVKEYQARLSRGNQGGPLLMNEALDLNVLNFPPKDQIGLALQDMLKTKILNAYRIPQPQMDMQDANFAGAKASERSYQKNCLKPRHSYIRERITHGIVSKFDDRLYLEAEDFIERDEQMEEQKKVTAISAYTSGLTTKNEARAVFDLPPDPQGNAYYVAPAPSVPGLSLSLDGMPATMPTLETKASVAPSETDYDKYSLKPVVAIMQHWFSKQKEHVLSVAKTKGYRSKAWVDLSAFSDDMAQELYPALMIYYEGAARSLMTRFGLTDDVWQVTQPKLAEAVSRAALHLADSTNKTTTLALDEARERLRAELTDGLTGGDSVQELTKRVGSIFESASEERAWLIADSERTRAIGTGELITAKESGVVKSKVWLPDSRACDKCSALRGVSRGLDEPFAVDQHGGPYAVIQHPPRHPGCRCTMTYEIQN